MELRERRKGYIEMQESLGTLRESISSLVERVTKVEVQQTERFDTIFKGLEKIETKVDSVLDKHNSLRTKVAGWTAIIAVGMGAIGSWISKITQVR